MNTAFISSIPLHRHHNHLPLNFTRHRQPLPRLPHPRKPTTLATSDLVPQQPPLHNRDIPRIHRILRSLYPFSRPHTIHGTIISIISLSLLACLLTATNSHTALLSLRSSLPPALLTNLYIVGLNQLHDVPLDRVNKPHLPLPAGDLSLGEARTIIYAALSLACVSLCVACTPPLAVVVIGSTLLGTAYSAPPLRLKRYAALASAAIMCVRGFLVNTCFFLHASGTTTLPMLVQFAVAFFTLFGTVIALLKDVPDIPGDQKYGIMTFSVRMGGDVVFNICVAILATLFLCGAAVFGVAAWGKFAAGGVGVVKGVIGLVGALIHLMVACWIWVSAREVDVRERWSVTKYYMNSWKVFYLEYLLLPLAAL